MARLGTNYNLEEMDMGEDFQPIPAGDYTFAVKTAELKQTKNGTGEYIKLACQVIGPTNSGRIIFKNINLVNANADAQRIGRQELARFMAATGINQLSDTDQLVGRTFVGTVKVTPKTDEFEAGNEITKFKAADTAARPQETTSTGTGSPAAPKRPW